MKSPSELTVSDLTKAYSEVFPGLSDQRVIFSQLLDSIAFVESQGSMAWSLSIQERGFRLNVGTIEAMTFNLTQHEPEDAPSTKGHHAAHIRLLVTGIDCLKKIQLTPEGGSIEETTYKSVGERNWCYWGTFEVGGNKIQLKSRNLVAQQLAALCSNHHSFLSLACRTPTGKLRQKSNYAQHHCQALYEYARLVVATKGEVLSERNDAQQANEMGVVGYQRMAAEAEVNNDPQSTDISETTRQALIDARIGQGKYRSSLMKLWGRQCAVTGCPIEELLIASHAKRWADADNRERLDPYNGLLLVANIDRLFDAGMISFSDEGAMLVGHRVERSELESLGVPNGSRLRIVHSRHIPYFKAHRARFGFH
jgi:hypothetical protein